MSRRCGSPPAMKARQALELWCGKRKVKSFPAKVSIGSRIRASSPPSGPVLQLEPAAMRLGRGARQREAEARAAGRAVARGFEADERLLDLAEFRFGDARAPVGDLDRDRALAAAHRDLRRSAIFDAVVDQVAHRPAQQIGLHRGGLARAFVERHGVAERAQLLDDGVGERADVDRRAPPRWRGRSGRARACRRASPSSPRWWRSSSPAPRRARRSRRGCAARRAGF